jgi:hypothetical protein
MLRLSNRTPFALHAFAAHDRERRDMLVVVVRGTFQVRGSDGATTVAKEQPPIVLADEHHGEPGASSVRYESDLAPGKPGTDVILVGSAHAPPGGIDTLVVTLQAGVLTKSVRVSGDRQWARDGLGRYRPSSPARFMSIPLVYELAFGGRNDPRNPVGVGYVSTAAPTADDRVPNLEDPEQPLRALGERPQPAGFGAIHRSWQPRVAFAGTADETWRRDRAPFLPDDFDPRYHLAASEGLSTTPHFVGGEIVRVNNVRPGGLPFALRVPMRRLAVSVRIGNKNVEASPVLDTIVLEPERERMSCTWRAAISCPRQILRVERVRLSDATEESGARAE